MQRSQRDTINPTRMSREQQLILAAYLQEHAQDNLLDCKQTHQIRLAGENRNREFTVTHNILRRKRKDSKEGARYEVLDKELGKGANGCVHLSLGTLVIKNGLAVFKSKHRAVKEFYSNDDAVIEYDFTHKIPLMHAKPLSSAPGISFWKSKIYKAYMVEKYFSGRNLFEIIEEEQVKPLYDANQRIQLSLDILLAIQEFHQLNLLHRDIKPENIMIDTTTNKPTLIDFRYCIDLNNPKQTPQPGGTPVTMPPEQCSYGPIEKQIYTKKSDCYAAGKTLAELWGADAEANSILTGFIKFYQSLLDDTKFNYANFLAGDLSNAHVERIKDMLESMTRSVPENRWTIEQAIKLLQQIQAERNQLKNNQTKRSGKDC